MTFSDSAYNPRPYDPQAGATCHSMEPLFEALFEASLQIVLEILVELGLRRGANAAAQPTNPWLAAFGYVVLGAIAGGLSLLIFPAMLLTTPAARFANLLLTPLAAGAVMVGIGWWRVRKQHRVIRLDRFVYAYLFALAMAIVRVAFCR